MLKESTLSVELQHKNILTNYNYDQIINADNRMLSYTMPCMQFSHFYFPPYEGSKCSFVN